MDAEKTIDELPIVKYRLWNPKKFIALSPLFSFLLPGILFSLNIGKLGDKRRQNFLIVIFSAIFVLFIVGFFLLPSNLGNTPKYIGEAINIAIASYLYSIQKNDYEKWTINGIKEQSLLIPVLVSIIPVLAFVGFLIYSDAPKPRLEYKEKEDSLFYDRSIPIEDVKSLYAGLEKYGVFEVDNRIFGGLMIDEQNQYGFGWSYKEGTVYNDKIKLQKAQFEEYMNNNIKLKKKIEFIPLDSKLNRLGIK